jgi:hypothetical protein
MAPPYRGPALPEYECRAAPRVIRTRDQYHVVLTDRFEFKPLRDVEANERPPPHADYYPRHDRATARRQHRLRTTLPGSDSS